VASVLLSAFPHSLTPSPPHSSNSLTHVCRTHPSIDIQEQRRVSTPIPPAGRPGNKQRPTKTFAGNPPPPLPPSCCAVTVPPHCGGDPPADEVRRHRRHPSVKQHEKCRAHHALARELGLRTGTGAMHASPSCHFRHKTPSTRGHATFAAIAFDTHGGAEGRGDDCVSRQAA
jgi:hypothetical protein